MEEPASQPSVPPAAGHFDPPQLQHRTCREIGPATRSLWRMERQVSDDAAVFYAHEDPTVGGFRDPGEEGELAVGSLRRVSAKCTQARIRREAGEKGSRASIAEFRGHRVLWLWLRGPGR